MHEEVVDTIHGIIYTSHLTPPPNKLYSSKAMEMAVDAKLDGVSARDSDYLIGETKSRESPRVEIVEEYENKEAR
jgi:hypothetical protein